MGQRAIPPPPSAPAGAPGDAEGHDADRPGVAVSPGVRAQLLATEHWSLLATRSTAQSEVLARITTFLMLVSASIVSLALIGQVTRFDRRFVTFALVLVGMLLMIGTLTQMRVATASIEDLALVIGMNRLRAGYMELDPGVERYFVTSPHDDDVSIWKTYNHLMGPRRILQPLASSAAFILLVNTALAGVLAALVAAALKASGPLLVVVAVIGGALFLCASILPGLRQVRALKRRPVLFPARRPESPRKATPS